MAILYCTEGSDRQTGVRFSGMDILDEIRALVTERSYDGQIKLGNESAIVLRS